jgi:DNA-binding CsgD family transcriptional regulator/tetratricopeptide (TPR) repeat protein
MRGVIVRPILCRSFVGRREEIAFFDDRRRDAARSHGGLVLVAGDAGVGKSRLVAEATNALAYSRWHVALGSCLEIAGRPYGPILDIIARLGGVPFAMPAVASQREQFDALAARLSALAARHALLLVIEDVHWADRATLEFLAYFGTMLGRLRVLVVATYRSSDVHAHHPSRAILERVVRNARADRIDLQPLAGDELRHFIDEALGAIVLPPQTRRAVERAGDGNPFFTEELLKAAVEGGASANDDARVPASIRATLLDRLRPFSLDERAVLREAAVIGRTFSLDVLATSLDVDRPTLLATLARARDHQLVEETAPSVFRFRHALTREAIYGDVLGADVRPRHRAIAGALEAAADAALEALAYHWWAAGDAERSATYNDRAGDAATSVHAHEDAIAFYERALESSAGPFARGVLHQKIAERRAALTRTEAARSAFGIAADLYREAGAFEREAMCRVRVSLASYTLHVPEPEAPLVAMLARTDPAEYVTCSRLHAGLAWLYSTFWYPTRADDHLVQIDPRARVEIPELELRFRNKSAWNAMTFGDLSRFRDEHRAWIDAAVAMHSITALAGAHYNGATCYSLLARHTDAQEHIDRAFAIARDARSKHAEECTQQIAAFHYIVSGDLPRAKDAVEAIPVGSENRTNAMVNAAWATFVGMHLGDDALVAKWFDAFEAAVIADPDSACGGPFAEVMARRGRSADARRVLHASLPDCELMRGNLITLLAVARHGSDADRTRAREQLVRAAAGERELPERPALALFDAILAANAGDVDAERAHARIAADGFRRLRYPLFEAEARERAGEFDTARALYRSCGASADLTRLDRRTSPREPADLAHAILSSREREIGTLAAAGRTNLEIAAALAISRKTVEKHLTSLYAKLNITNRTQLTKHL